MLFYLLGQILTEHALAEQAHIVGGNCVVLLVSSLCLLGTSVLRCLYSGRIPHLQSLR